MSRIVVRQKWKYDKRSLEQFSRNIGPSKITSPNTIDNIAIDFTDRLNMSATATIKKTTGKMKTRKNAVWWDDECMEAVKERRKAHRNLCNHLTDANLEIYKEKHSILISTMKCL